MRKDEVIMKIGKENWSKFLAYSDTVEYTIVRGIPDYPEDIVNCFLESLKPKVKRRLYTVVDGE